MVAKKCCTKCKRSKSTHDFYTDKRRSDGLRSHCKGCHNEGVRKWQVDNRSKDLANKRAYKAKQYAEFGEELRAEWREWYKGNPDYARAKEDRRRTMKIGATQGDVREIADCRAILKCDPCSYCGETGGTVDHIVALNNGGAHSTDNLAGACLSCNSSKSDKPLLLWMLEKVAQSSA